MSTIICNNLITSDRRLDRIPRFDERSLQFPIRQLVGNQRPRSYAWACPQAFDQGQEGACAAFAAGHELCANPAPVWGLDTAFLIEKIYWPAQRTDPWPGGSYPDAQPRMDGTSLLDVAKAVRELGLIGGFRWGFSMQDIILGVGWDGPCILGWNWHQGMIQTDSRGYIHPTGPVMGGHSVILRGVDMRNQRFLGRNSWGRGWGINADFWITFREADILRQSQGEQLFYTGRVSR